MHVGRIRGLREDADAYILLRQGDGIDVVGHFTDDIRFPSDPVKPLDDGLNAGAPPRNDQRIIGQLRQRHFVPLQLCQRMLPRDDGNPRLLADDNAVEMLMIVGVGNDGKVREPPCQMLQHIVGAAVPHLVLNHGIFLAEARNEARGDVRRPSFHHAEGNGSGKAVFHMCQIRPGLVRQRQHLIGPMQQKAPRLRQLQMPFAADEQLYPQVLLQRFDLVGERRLAHVQLLRRPCEIQLLCHDGKIFQRTEIHALFPFHVSEFSPRTYPNPHDGLRTWGLHHEPTACRMRWAMTCMPALLG